MKFAQFIISKIIKILPPDVHFKDKIHKIRFVVSAVSLFVRL